MKKQNLITVSKIFCIGIPIVIVRVKWCSTICVHGYINSILWKTEIGKILYVFNYSGKVNTIQILKIIIQYICAEKLVNSQIGSMWRHVSFKYFFFFFVILVKIIEYSQTNYYNLLHIWERKIYPPPSKRKSTFLMILVLHKFW